MACVAAVEGYSQHSLQACRTFCSKKTPKATNSQTDRTEALARDHVNGQM
jgi:hypothetical protein